MVEFVFVLQLTILLKLDVVLVLLRVNMILLKADVSATQDIYQVEVVVYLLKIVLITHIGTLLPPNVYVTLPSNT